MISKLTETVTLKNRTLYNLNQQPASMILMLVESTKLESGNCVSSILDKTLKEKSTFFIHLKEPLKRSTGKVEQISN